MNGFGKFWKVFTGTKEYLCAFKVQVTVSSSVLSFNVIFQPFILMTMATKIKINYLGPSICWCGCDQRGGRCMCGNYMLHRLPVWFEGGSAKSQRQKSASFFPYASLQWRSNKPKIKSFGELCHDQKYVGQIYWLLTCSQTDLVPISAFLCGPL